MRAAINKERRQSPQPDKMKLVRDRDGTVWAFASPSQRDHFNRNRKKLEAKSNHFLSPREIISQITGHEV